jgi:hypothetical protein
MAVRVEWSSICSESSCVGGRGEARGDEEGRNDDERTWEKLYSCGLLLAGAPMQRCRCGTKITRDVFPHKECLSLYQFRASQLAG